MCERDQLRADETLLGHQLQLARVADQLRRNEHRDILDVLTSVTGGLLALEMGVDRHLSNASSTDRVDEVDGCSAAFRSDRVQR